MKLSTLEEHPKILYLFHSDLRPNLRSNFRQYLCPKLESWLGWRFGYRFWYKFGSWLEWRLGWSFGWQILIYNVRLLARPTKFHPNGNRTVHDLSFSVPYARSTGELYCWSSHNRINNTALFALSQCLYPLCSLRHRDRRTSSKDSSNILGQFFETLKWISFWNNGHFNHHEYSK